MLRTTFVFPALAAIAGCGEDGCPRDETSCSGLCVRLPEDPNNCGACGLTCDTGSVCRASNCEPMCAADQTLCDATCVNVQTDAAHCGGCATACGADVSCVTGRCAVPLAALQTSRDDRTIDRDLFVLRDATFDLTQLDHATFATSRVIDHQLLPDGSIVFVGAEEAEGRFELFRVPPGGGTVTKLSATLAAGGNVQAGVAVSKDGKSLLYRADQDTAGIVELYLVKLATPGVAKKVNGALVAGGNVSRVFAISADGTRATYVADQDTDDLNEAYTVDLSAATPASVKLNATISTLFDLDVSADGTKVVYRAQVPASGGAIGLFFVAAAQPGVANAIVNADGTGGQVEAYHVAADGSAVVYSSSISFLQESLWRAPLATPFDSTRLADGTGGGVRQDFVVTKDGARVYFRQVDTGTKRLFRVDVAAPGVRTLLSSNAMTSDATVADFVLAKDEKSLAFRGGSDGAEGGFVNAGTDPPFFFDGKAPTIFDIDLTAAAAQPVQLNPAIVEGHEGIGAGYVMTFDGRVIYRADHDTIGNSDAYLASPATPGTVRKVSPALNATTDASDVSVLSSY